MGFLTGISDHGLLSGLADDDHTQYVLRNILTTDGDLFSRTASAVTRIAAVASGQVLTSAGTGTLPAWSATPTLTSLTCPTLDGGTAANDDITIQGTTHSTRTTSYVLLQPNGGKVGIGTTEPSVMLETKGEGTGALLAHFVFRDSSSNENALIFRNGTGRADLLASYYGTAIASNLTFTPTTAAGVQTEAMRVASTGIIGIGTDGPTVSGTGKLHMTADTFRLDTARTPASAGAAGNAGEICGDADYIYRCTATNTWKRAAIATWA